MSLGSSTERLNRAVEQLADLLLEKMAEPLAERVAIRLGLAADQRIPDPESGWLNSDQLAARIGVCTETVRAWRKQPGFPCTDISKGSKKSVYRYQVGKVEAWLRDR